ncbi:hypothetical protein, partial [Clostridium perfringens]|uniref:hypothetical protein n=1 Tax=Clostridium perfringens TaxID=1502 RepID=UPI002AF6B17B
IVLIVAFITLIYTLVILVLDDVKKFKKHNECEKDEENEWDIIQKAIITIGNEKIEVEVDYYEINYNIIKVKEKDGELYVTDLKNVLLSSNEINNEVA